MLFPHHAQVSSLQCGIEVRPTGRYFLVICRPCEEGFLLRADVAFIRVQIDDITLVMGAGLIGLRRIAAIQASPECHLVGVIEPNSDLHTDETVRYFASMDDVDAAADGVVIATPTTLHAENGIAAAARGWHMLIEKPVVAEPGEAPALADAINRAGLHCLAGITDATIRRSCGFARRSPAGRSAHRSLPA